jgi:hypothetical protein
MNANWETFSIISAAGQPEGVAQTSGLLYRRPLVCRAPGSSSGVSFSSVKQTGSLRYSRPEVCATYGVA